MILLLNIIFKYLSLLFSLHQVQQFEFYFKKIFFKALAQIFGPFEVFLTYFRGIFHLHAGGDHFLSLSTEAFNTWKGNL